MLYALLNEDDIDPAVIQAFIITCTATKTYLSKARKVVARMSRIIMEPLFSGEGP